MDFSDSLFHTGPPLTISDLHLPDPVDDSGSSSFWWWSSDHGNWNITNWCDKIEKKLRRKLKEVTQEVKTLRVTIITCNKIIKMISLLVTWHTHSSLKVALSIVWTYPGHIKCQNINLLTPTA